MNQEPGIITDDNCCGYRRGAWKLAGSNHVLRHDVRLATYLSAAAFVKSTDVLHGIGVVTDNSGHIILSTIFGIPHGN
ncbi:hypothetical protein ACIQW9_00735 [Herminiimonas sp. NPDC097707]|uniref:hypothetical protein n=1 Tax=Herminiimonas sp. NPDC097707 TaxID=3364007 RepID=UPI00383A4AC4